MALPVTDTFTTGADADLTAYSASWSMNSGAMRVLAASDDVHPNASGTEIGAFHNVETFNNNQYSQAVVNAISTGSTVGVAVRCGAAGVASYYHYYGSSAASYLAKMVTGSWTQLGSDGSGFTVTDVVYIEANGTTITPKIDGSTTGTPGAQTDSSLASGKGGLAGWGVSSSLRVDNFEAGDLAGAPVSPKHLALLGVG